MFTSTSTGLVETVYLYKYTYGAWETDYTIGLVRFSGGDCNKYTHASIPRKAKDKLHNGQEGYGNRKQDIHLRINITSNKAIKSEILK